MKRLTPLLCFAVLMFILSSLPQPARADTIVVTETTTASGSLDGTAFTDALLTLTLTGDTTNLNSATPGVFSIIGTGIVSVAGIGNDAFTDQVDTVVTHDISGAGISDLTTNHLILFTLNSAFSTYGLTSSLGPLSGSGIHNPAFIIFPTTGGSFDIDSIGTVTYTAVVGTSAVPEPGSLLLLGAGFAGLLGARKRMAVTVR